MATRKKKKATGATKAPSRPTSQKSLDKKASLSAGGITENSISGHNQLEIISEIPQSYVWALSVFISLVAIVAPLGQTPYGYNPDLYMASMLQVGALVFLSVYLFLVYKNKSDGILIPHVPLLLFPVLAFYLWMVLSLFWAHNFYEAIVKVLDWGAGFIIFFLALMCLRDRRSIFPMIFCLFCSLVLIALLGVGQYLFSIDWVAQHASPAATFGNKNMNGEFLILTWILGVGLFINSRKPAASWFYALGSALALAALFYGRTRGSWFSWIVEMAILVPLLVYFKFGLVHKYNWGLPKILALAGFIVVTVALVNTTPQFFVSTVPVIEKNTGGIDRDTNPRGGAVQAESASKLIESAKKSYDATKNQRLIMWRNSYNMFKDHWLLGVGIGNWMVYYPKYQESYAVDPALRGETLFHINAHNDYVEFICELGLVGLLLMLWVVFAALIGIVRVFSLRSELRKEDQVMVMTVVIAILGIAANAFVSFPLQQPITIAIAMLYVGILAGAVWQSSDASERTFYRLALPSPALKMAGATAATVVTVAMLAIQIIWYKSDNLYFKAVSNYSAGNYKTSFEAAQESYKEFPIRKRTMYYIGNYYYRNQEYEKALPLFEEIRKDYPYRRQVLNALSGVYLELGKTDEFDSLVGAWSTSRANSASVLLTKAISEIRRDNPREAIAILEEASNLPGSGQTKERIDSILQKLYQAMDAVEEAQLKARIKAEKRARFLAERRAQRKEAKRTDQ